MIRIADILKKISSPEALKESKPVEIKLDIIDFSEIILALKSILAQTKVDEEALKNNALIMSNVGKIVDYEMQVRNLDLLKIVDKQSEENKTYAHAIKMAILSIKMGLDTKYSRQQLIELAVYALISDFERVNLPNQLSIAVFKEIISPKINLRSPEYEKIFNLAQIYET